MKLESNVMKSPVVIQNKNSFSKVDVNQNDKNPRIYEKKGLFATSQNQSFKRLRQNNSCQNINSQSMSNSKTTKDGTKIREINLQSSRGIFQKASLERIVGSNECIKLFDTIEKIKNTQMFQVKNFNFRK